MALQEFELVFPEPAPLPERVSAFLAEADRRIDQLFETELNKRTPKFIPSDAELFFHGLQHITDEGLPLGRVFCEWGSGFGVATGLAALLGYDAYGVEIEPSLVDASRALASHQNIDITILEHDYMPEGFECYDGVGGAELVVPEEFTYGRDDIGSSARYDGMEPSLTEVDVFYKFPWPGDQEFTQEFFDAVAGDGAILLSYHGDKDLCAYRKIAEEFD